VIGDCIFSSTLNFLNISINVKKYNSSLKTALVKLYRIISIDRKDIVAIYGFAIFSGLLQLTLPLGIQTIISFVLAGSLSASIILLIVLVVGGVFFNGLLQVRQMQVIEKIEQKIFVRYSLKVADHLPHINIQKTDNYYLPELVNRFFETVSLQKGFSKILLEIPTAAIQLVFGLMLLSFYHPAFIAFDIVLFLVLLLILRYTAAQGMETNMLASDYKYKVAGWLQEIARNIKTFKYSKGTKLNLKETDALATGYVQARSQHFMVLLKQYWSLIAFKVIVTAAMLIVGSLLLINQQLNIGQFVAAELVILIVLAAVEKFIVNLDSVYDILTALEKLEKLTGSETESSGTLLLPVKNDGVSIMFENVSFAYPNKAIFDNISLRINKGEHVAVTGESGTGKSTLLRLLTGAFKPLSGNVLLDEVPLANYTLQSLRSQTGILLNIHDIFKGSLMNNLTMGNNNISLEEISQLAGITGLNEFIKQQPEGYDTLLDPEGSRLSKKIIQTILLTRALLGNHRMLLLDEPCHYLEDKYVETVIQYLKNDTKDTIVIATNDPRIINSCNRVILLRNKKAEIISNEKSTILHENELT
jgi:ATP-binding cassette subfamily B protein